MSKKKKEQRHITATNAIQMFWHCKMCLADVMEGKVKDVSPASYSQLDVGFTELGLQVWCRRHEVNVAHIDFEGQTHPCNMAMIKPGEVQ